MATSKVSFTIDNNVIEKVKLLAEKEKRSVSQIVSILLEESLVKREK